MAEPVDLLLLTWNRRHYAEKTIANLLADPADFRLYCWDNGSEDGTADLIASLDDPRIVVKHFSKKNIKQTVPCLWFFEMAESDVLGKIDDDILVPHGWIERIAPLVRSEPKFGMLGCWVFMEEDWDEELANKKSVTIAGSQVLPSMGMAGCAWLARTGHVRKHATLAVHGIPVDREGMSLAGLRHGCPLPVMFAHHMDDPRSPHYVGGGLNRKDASLTARHHGFESDAEYGQWIAKDARRALRGDFAAELRERRFVKKWGRLGRKFLKIRRKVGSAFL